MIRPSITTIVFGCLTTVIVVAGHAQVDERKKPKTNAEKVDAALKTWKAVKKKCGGNYSYSVPFHSAFGFGQVTIIEVKDNKVVSRKFLEYGSEAPRPQSENSKAWKWVEKDDEIGSHGEGAPAKTLDELYVQAKPVVTRLLAEHERRYVKTDANGLLTMCFTIDTRIADDAEQKGIAIANINVPALERAKVISELTAKPKATAFKDASREKPLTLKSKKDIEQYFAGPEVVKLRKSVNFDKQNVLVFAWGGSGQDKLSFDVTKTSPEKVVFQFEPGRTRDYVRHVLVVVIRADVKWSMK